MKPKAEAINFRVESGITDRLRALAEQNRRGVSDELRAGIEIYLLLIEMTNLRASVELDPSRAEEMERAIKDEFGRIFMAALSLDAENAFENDVEVEYPRDTFREIAMPFDRLLEWVAGIPAESRASNAELVAEAHNWSDASRVIEPQGLPPRGKLRLWVRALELAGDETATLSRVQQALRIISS